MAEYQLVICRCCRTASYRFRIINIMVRINRCVSSITCSIILDNNAVSADQFAAPFCIQIQLTYCRRILRIDFRRTIDLAVFFYRIMIDRERIKIESMSKTFVRIPSYEIEINPLASDITDLFTFINVECFSLRCAVIRDFVRCAVIWMQIDLIFINSPFCIQRHIMSRHLIKFISVAHAVLVVIPTEESESSVCWCDVVLCYICFVVDIGSGIEISTLNYTRDRIPTAVYKDTIAVINVKSITRIS